jgi:hypothetical protein
MNIESPDPDPSVRKSNSPSRLLPDFQEDRRQSVAAGDVVISDTLHVWTMPSNDYPA